MTWVTIMSMFISLGGLALGLSLIARAWQRHARHPSNVTTWMFLASFALTIAFLTLFLSALIGGIIQSGEHGQFVDGLAIIVMTLRGVLVALGISLWMGWRGIRELNGGR